MKKVTVFVLCWMMVCANAQSFKLYEVVNGAEADEIQNGTTLIDTCEEYASQIIGELGAVVENASSESKMVVCEREIIHLEEGAMTEFCWNSCWGMEVFIDSMRMEANAKTAVGEFATHYTAPAVAGSSIVRYVFYDRENRDDSVSVIFEYFAPEGTSVPAYTLSASLSVFPNPTREQLRIFNYELRESTTVEIYNVMGQKILSIESLQSTETTTDVSTLASGMYFLKIGNSVVKFIKE